MPIAMMLPVHSDFHTFLPIMDDRKKRDRKLRKKRDRLNDRNQFALKLERRRSFPMVSVGSQFEDTENLVNQIADAIKALVDSNQLPQTLRRDLELMKAGELNAGFRSYGDISKEFGQILYQYMDISHQQLDRIGFRIEVLIGIPNHWTITVIVYSLKKLGTRLFCSPKQYTANFDGKSRIVAYKYHTLEQIGNRLIHDPNDYHARAMSFAIPFYTKYFETAELSNGQPCIKLWNTCDPLTFLGPVHGELLGSNVCLTFIRGIPYFTIEGAICYYLLGYCPIHFDESQELVVLESLWIPGMDKTPEWAAYKKKHKPDTVGLANFSKHVNAHTYSGLVQNRDLQYIRELHEFVPQVRAMNEPVFDYPHLLDEVGPSIPWGQLANLNNADRNELVAKMFVNNAMR